MEISDAVDPMMTMLLGSNIFDRFWVGIVIGSQRFSTLQSMVAYPMACTDELCNPWSLIPWHAPMRSFFWIAIFDFGGLCCWRSEQVEGQLFRGK